MFNSKFNVKKLAHNIRVLFYRIFGGFVCIPLPGHIWSNRSLNLFSRIWCICSGIYNTHTSYTLDNCCFLYKIGLSHRFFAYGRWSYLFANGSVCSLHSFFITLYILFIGNLTKLYWCCTTTFRHLFSH